MIELNKKLAKWAGFQYMDKVYWVFKPHPTYESFEMYGARWITPDGGAATYELPNFTEDETACFKWLVPLALEVLYKRGYLLPIMKLFQLWYDELVSLTGDSSNISQPALALCRAIEKLIEVKDGTG